MTHALEATYYRTALLLGLAPPRTVRDWAYAIIERESTPPPALIEVVSLSDDLTAIRAALWPLAIEPEPVDVFVALLALLAGDLASGRRSAVDTVTILRQMRSMLRLPRSLYASLNEALVDYGAHGGDVGVLTVWLAQFEAPTLETGLPIRRSP